MEGVEKEFDPELFELKPPLAEGEILKPGEAEKEEKSEMTLRDPAEPEGEGLALPPALLP